MRPSEMENEREERHDDVGMSGREMLEEAHIGRRDEEIERER